MTQRVLHFVDPSIPGLSGRDLIERPIKAVVPTDSRAHSPARTLRGDLSRLDRHQLRDLGIDRNAA